MFLARLLPRPGGAFVSGPAWGVLPAPSVHEVVVTRRDDGTEALRFPAGGPFVAGDVLRAVDTEPATPAPGGVPPGWDVR